MALEEYIKLVLVLVISSRTNFLVVLRRLVSFLEFPLRFFPGFFLEYLRVGGISITPYDTIEKTGGKAILI